MTACADSLLVSSHSSQPSSFAVIPIKAGLTDLCAWLVPYHCNLTVLKLQYMKFLLLCWEWGESDSRVWLKRTTDHNTDAGGFPIIAQGEHWRPLHKGFIQSLGKEQSLADPSAPATAPKTNGDQRGKHAEGERVGMRLASLNAMKRPGQ